MIASDFYHDLLLYTQQRFFAVADAPALFLVEQPPGGLYERFVEALPAELRQRHNCRACRSFVDHYGRVKLANKAMARALTSIVEVVCGDAMDLRKLAELVGDLACRANESRDLINVMRAQLGDQLALRGIEAAPEIMHEVAARVMADERVMLASIRELLKP